MHKDLDPAAAPAATPSAGAPAKLDAYWMPFTANRQFKKAPRLLAKAKGMHYWTPEGRQVLDGSRRPLVRQRRPCPAEDRRGDRSAGRRDGLRAAVQHGAPEGVRARRAGSSQIAPAGPRLGVLHQLGLGVRRHRAEDGDRLPPRARRGPAHAPDRPRARLPRRQLRRHLGRRHRRQPQDASAPCSAASTTCATRTTSRSNAFTRGQPEHGAELADDLERIVALHDASTIAAVIVEPVAGSTGVLIPPQGLPRAPARDLRQARHPADLRRGHHRLRPPRRAVRGEALRRHARPDDRRQGHHQRLRADGRGVREEARSTTSS